MTFTIGKHRMRNGEEAEVVAVVGDYVVGYFDIRKPCWWTAKGAYGACPGPHQFDLLPPSPPKLEPIVDWVVRDKHGNISAVCVSEFYARQLRERRTLETPCLCPYTIHKRVTEQVED